MPGIRKSKSIYFIIACVVGISVVFNMLSCASMDTATSRAGPQPLYKVGYQVLDLKYEKGRPEQTLTVAVWYPTAAEPKSHSYGGPTNGNIAVNAAPLAEGGPYPLLVFSHGYGGSGIGAVFFTEALAARGWIVVCPDHHDRHSAVRIRTGQQKDFDRRGLLQHASEIAATGPADRGMYLYRLDEMQLALDSIMDSVPFSQLIDRDRIAVGGHSFGGFTALGLSGTIKEYHDPRIKAVLLFSTGAGGYLFSEDELANVRIPSMLFMGEREQQQKRGAKTMAELSAKIYTNMPSPNYFLEVKKASHFSFNNRFTNKLGSRLLSGTEKQFALIRRYSIAFLDKYVAGSANSDYVLEHGDPLLTRYLMKLTANISR